MRNSKPANIVDVGNLFGSMGDRYIVFELPIINAKKRSQVYRKFKDSSKRLKASSLIGRIKQALAILYFITLVYFLTLLFA